MKVLFAAAAAAGLLVASPTFAQGFGQETYLNVGYTSFALDQVRGQDVSDADFNLGAVTGRFGSKLNTNFGLEAELGVGVQDQEATLRTTTVTSKLNYEAAAFAVGYLPVTTSTELFARVGVGRIEIESEVTPPTGAASGGGAQTIFGLGVGVQHFFDGVNGIRGDYTRYTGEERGAEADALGISYVRRF
ncbi:MAG: porin family protein [Proteobacteria bacterium]|nr:porin family protein [Pseudomonadota bacterium]